ncbi:MAG: phosphoribosylglycinamide formyltransferase, partial [Spirochaetia bacterium]|nr:phosphoribosylglycinamide formyltransferase [Spirochaetia bacterium]
MTPKVVSFLASGQGTNFSAAAEKIKSGYIKARLGILVSDNDAPALRKAESFGMKSFLVNPKDYSSKQDYEDEMIRLFREHKSSLIVAAGYMRILSPRFVRAFQNRIINVHPSLLPAFPGREAQRQALDYGVKVTGCTTHFIDEGTDTGPIIMQSAIPLLQSDNIASISKKIRAEEHKILSESIKLFCEDRLKIIN